MTQKTVEHNTYIQCPNCQSAWTARVEATPNWTKLPELPKINGDYYITLARGGVEVDWFDVDSGTWKFCEEVGEDVIAWAKLTKPEPFKGE
ncbi:hypothetical protein [uncultured Flavobacterium sp.]|uniref:hypothetical protein n=1 Tax=uncultured Flavobacterium sp. TaxID=165435 RepID=UPI0025959D45|nr:hypothetical protein [uncultured Flavobacterium sp.]